MKKLKNTTLICVDGVGKTESALKSIEASTLNIEYEKVVLITPDLNIKSNNKISVSHINKMSWNDYNEFILKDLTNYFDTTYVLLTQDDGFVSNSENWTDEFFEYDYIGAPWPIYLTNHLLVNLSNNTDFHGNPFKTNIPKLPNYDLHNYRVGNGGFSFRSKRLCNLTKNYANKYPEKPEDCIISLYEREDIYNHDMYIAPVKVAAKFSVESPNEFNLTRDISQTFGFHRFNY
jgi:hypothetical protein